MAIIFSVRSPRVGEIDCAYRSQTRKHSQPSCCLSAGRKLDCASRELANYFLFSLDMHMEQYEVTGSRKHGKGLEVPYVYMFVGKEKKL